jgi:multicomponent Na+:H+ antiporter subunit E
LAAVWLLLSGHYDALILTFGAISCAFVTMLALRLKIIDGESQPLHMGWRLPMYWVWLLIEIIKANVDVAKRIIDPRLPIDPHLFETPMTQKSDLGRVIFANSITLTPGTVSVDIGNDTILVHALTKEGEEALATGEMDAKVSELER